VLAGRPCQWVRDYSEFCVEIQNALATEWAGTGGGRWKEMMIAIVEAVERNLGQLTQQVFWPVFRLLAWAGAA
jgi:hypothetical protein